MDFVERAATGFQSVDVPQEYRQRALDYLTRWLTQPEFADYLPQLHWLIECEQFAGLIDRFYQILPFGTGGRRGSVGIGPNRMNYWTLGASVQGHCEYLKQRFPGEKRLSVVVAYDVRQFEDQRRQYNPALPNPTLHLSSKALAQYAAGVYAANGIQTHILPPDSPAFLATPELSFLIRQFKSHGGLNISASHNPPDDNGAKFYDERGAQPVPPEDQLMADLVDQVKTIRQQPFVDAVRAGKVQFVEDASHQAYIELCRRQSLVPPPRTDDFKVVFTPLHGVGSMTAMEVLTTQGFRVVPVSEQMAPDGQFPNVTRSPNPEVPESMDRAAALAVQTRADLVLATDPDADRIGMMAPDSAGQWHVINGNQIAALLTHFKLHKLAQAGRLPPSPIVVRTEVTTSLISRIARAFNCQLIDNLLVGFKYVAEVLWQLESTGTYEDVQGSPADFILATEESHGALLTAQLRDKDAGCAALLLAELALDQKRRGKTVLDYLEDIHREFGYFHNASVSIQLPGIQGRQLMGALLDSLREQPLQQIDRLKVTSFADLQDEDGPFGPLKGPTDKASRNVLLFHCGEAVRVALRPSGTEPKAKVYVEVSSAPYRAGSPVAEWLAIKKGLDAQFQSVVRDFLRQALARIGMNADGCA